jgi:glutamate synthase (NADPH/NADH) large chain/glutamate synthase (ferredoxin)
MVAEFAVESSRPRPDRSGLVDQQPSDSCGAGFIASVNGTPQRRILDLGLTSLANVFHRGAIGADGKTGDGTGVSTTIPKKLLLKWLREIDCFAPPPLVGVGVLFLPRQDSDLESALKTVRERITSRGLVVLGFRDVPVDANVLGDAARHGCPAIKHVFIAGKGTDEQKFERELFLARRAIELTPTETATQTIHIASMSGRTIVYKGMVLSTLLGQFYPDLQEPEYECSICIYHQRFSTNTTPQWSLCQPFRMLAHNGEINTIRGNRNWMTARESMFYHPYWEKSDRHLLRRLFNFRDSDSASLDNVLELLTLSGRSILHAMSMLIPPAWEHDPRFSDSQKAFFEFHSCFCEPWDGPAAIAMTDGQLAAACLDRNGLRPLRYRLTNDGIFVLGSEVGADRVDTDTVIEKGRLGPGQMIAVDTVRHRILYNDEIKESLAARRPYGQWLRENRIEFRPPSAENSAEFLDFEPTDFLRHQIAAGLTREEIEIGIANMATDGVEPTYSMGVDTPLAVLSQQPRHLTDYFKQRFAQVTNPPIDSIREQSVMSIAAGLGPERNILDESPVQCRVVNLTNPVLLPGELAQLVNSAPFKFEKIDCTWPASAGEAGLESELKRVIADALIAVENHATVLILSDRKMDENRIAIPMLLVVGAIHHALCKAGQRMMCSLVAETSDVRDPHQLALLFGYGCTAVDPYLAYTTIAQLSRQGTLECDDLARSIIQFRAALTKGLLKIMSKMGISVLNSYQGAQIFEAIGLGPGVIEKCFKYSYSNVDGIGFADIARDCIVRHAAAYKTGAAELEISDLGITKPRHSGEHHVINGKVTKTLHQFVRENRREDFEEFREQVAPQRPVALRDLLRLTPATNGRLPIDEVESIESIRRRFTTAAMSLGAISPEAHEAIAIAMNEIGGKSNSGEGGEDTRRFKPFADGTWANSKIKQVASGRFGVNPEYLAAAEEIEIKMAQGAKPGEGGQLPGFKVNGLIAKLRNTDPGVTLISPPPHHDIYSIEDLAQLIYDLKMVNPLARVCVKLVAKTGVGGIAVGVAKSNADAILISGHEGGTGASPLTSIKHAGIPWELGLSETHQSLVAAGLRDRVVLRADGGLRTGRDIIHAAILGAEEYNFGTMTLIALGCVYVKKCHLNNCPVGIATQDPKYRSKFKGRPENLVNYLNAVAGECRELLSTLGCPTIDSLIGQTQLLTPFRDESNRKTFGLDLAPILARGSQQNCGQVSTAEKYARPLPVVPGFDDQLIAQLPVAELDSQPLKFEAEVSNTDRDIGTRVSGLISSRFGKDSLPENSVQLRLRGTAGQSLGAFLCAGMSIHLVGDANDYVGKGMCGGEIVIRPPVEAAFASDANVIAGNTILYGATGGKFFASGAVGERLCIRNSGAIAVVEGCGDHGCEYMTKGIAVILGRVGNNFGAGMTGGSAFVYDPDARLESLCNLSTIEIGIVADRDAELLKELLGEFEAKTQSQISRRLLADWPRCLNCFRQIAPQREDQPTPVSVGHGVTAAGPHASKRTRVT